MARPSKKQQPDALDARQELLRAAAKLFAERGFNATGVQDITAAAGVNKAMLYYYFGSKDGLYDLLIAQGITAIAEAVAVAEEPGLSLHVRIYRLVSAYLTVVVEQPEIARIIYREALGAGESTRPVVVEHFTRTLQRVAAILDQAYDDGGLGKVDTLLAAYSLFGMANMFISSHFVTGRVLDVPLLADHIVVLFLLGVTPGGVR
ncbi:MAG TPA: TetR/AcrR family transcriptional regulator [Armatimonadota bacterium]|jgi:AcrR family transcriptional regulator